MGPGWGDFMIKNARWGTSWNFRMEHSEWGKHAGEIMSYRYDLLKRGIRIRGD